MPLQPGTSLGPYRIDAPLGAGGMGEVYKATDTRLDRTVAIKVLPEHVAADPELKQRFEREAKTISSLNHPHICTLYDIGNQNGIDFLVMEYLDGETLAQRLEKGALPLDQALQIAIEIADALDKAHRQGIVHRDLKPGNIMLTKGGAKLLDFGLAKLKPAEQVGGLSALPTQGAPLTQQGAILGTFQYMAPEQLEGQEADARTDIFAFGTVVYEMVTGRKAFEGKSQASLIGAVLHRDPPPILELEAATPPALDYIVGTCMAKDPDDRWQAPGDIAKQIRRVLEVGARFDEASPGSATMPSVHEATKWKATAAVGVAVAVVAAAVAIWFASNASPIPRASVVSILGTASYQPDGNAVAISPDGQTVVFVRREGGVTQLYQRRLDDLTATPIPFTERGHTPVFSPDGDWVAFIRDAGIERVRLSGGAAVRIVEEFAAVSGGLAWGGDEMIYFGQGGGVLARIPAAGGEAEEFSSGDVGNPSWMSVLPSGRKLLFTDWAAGASSRLGVLDLETEEWRVDALEATNPQFVPPGSLVFGRLDGSLWAAPFDPEGALVIGEPIPIVAGVEVGVNDAPQFDVSASGALAYVPDQGDELIIEDLESRERTLLTDDVLNFEMPSFSPDGSRVAVAVLDKGDRALYVYDVARGSGDRVTSADEIVFSPVWSEDGTSLFYGVGGRGVASRPANGGDSRLILEREGQIFWPHTWTPAGDRLAYSTMGSAIGPVELLDPVSGSSSIAFGQPTPLFTLDYSRDGALAALTLTDEGSREVWVQEVDEPSSRIRVSTAGGVSARWRADGESLYYIRWKEGDPTATLMLASIAREPLRVVDESALADWSGSGLRPVYQYDFHPDGRRLVRVQATGFRDVVLVQNWMAGPAR